MKLMSYSIGGRETWGVVLGDGVAELAGRTGHATLADFIASPDFQSRDALVEGLKADVKLAEVTFLPVIPRPEKIVCAVRNYMDHHQEVLAAGMQRELSEQPPIFLRVWRSQTPHQGPIVRPHVSDSLDWEGELAVVIGKEGRDICEADAWSHIAGYSCYNDASVREPASDGEKEYRVKQGDTLGRIAARLKPADVSLDMMLVALYRANPEAFIGNNMNRLKSGQILAVPDSDAIKGGADQGEARGVVVAHAADFNAYRAKLAGQVSASTPAKAPETSQSAGGKITAKVEERPTAVTDSKDQLKLSKATGAPAEGKTAMAGEEDKIAREKQVAEANARVKELEKNVADLEKLMAVKSKTMAEKQQTAAAPAAPAAPAADPAAA
eukprot:gene41817-51830_t